MNNLKDLLLNNWKKVLGLIILLAGLPLAIYLATHPQIFKPKADIEEANRLNVSNKAGDVQVEGDTPTIRVKSQVFDVSYNP